MLAILAYTVCAPLSAHAQGVVPSGWQFELTPYLWAAGFSGWSRIGERTPTVKFDASFSDVWRNLNFGAMGSFEARNGRWAIVFDAIYVKLSRTSDPLLGGELGTAKLSGDETILQLAGAYRVLDSMTTPVDVLVGIRFTDLYADLAFSQSALLPNGPSRSNSTNWTDGFVGVRAAYVFSDKWSVVGYADAGTGGTKYSWQLYAGANYNFTKTIVGKLGYRVLTQNYDKPDFLYNVRTSGVFAGVGIKF
jgi:opacity protein-like surface antigen